MCYNVKQLYSAALKRAKRKNVTEDIEHWKKKLKGFDELFEVLGYAHPHLIVYTNRDIHSPVLSVWGLIPYWVKNVTDAKKYWNKTLNARCETVFEKPSFKDSEKHKRCIIPVNGFYEHHHYNNKVYPFYIFSNNDEPLNLAGLWSTWLNKETDKIINSCCIVTTTGNKLLSQIHNNPKLKEPRMPVILEDGKEDEWLNGSNEEHLKQLLKPFPYDTLDAYTVKQLVGKKALGNIPEASDYYEYEDCKL